VKQFAYRFGYWRNLATGERQPAHVYVRALYGMGFAGGPYHADDCPGCKWFAENIVANCRCAFEDGDNSACPVHGQERGAA